MFLRTNTAIPVITGPTASGKTKIAILLAKRINGEIISADSMQIYRNLDIGTAKASTQEQDGINHHLYDIRDADERYSVAHFVKDATTLICDIIDRNKTPIICGGTGQYICALVDGLQFMDETTDLNYREEIRKNIISQGLDKAHAKLKALDSNAAERIDPADEKRITRFFEVYHKTGKTSSQVYAWSQEKGPDFPFATFVLWPEREHLYRKINERTEQMLDLGMVEELKHMLEIMPHFSETQAFQAIGYKEILPYVQGIESREEAVEKLARATRRYAKRQYSMFRSRLDFHKIDIHDPTHALNEILLVFNTVNQLYTET